MRAVGACAAVGVVLGLLWREAVGVGVLQASSERRRIVDVAVGVLGLVFAASAAFTVVELL